MFENVYGRNTDGRTPARPVYYKLAFGSGELKIMLRYVIFPMGSMSKTITSC